MEKSTLASVGAVVTASLASLCCAGPIVLAVMGMVGMGGAELGLDFFEPYRPYLMPMTALFLGIGFYLTYRTRAEICDANGVCIAPKSIRMRKVGLWTVTGFTGLMLAVPYLPMGSMSSISQDDTDEATIVLALEGMT